MVGDLLEAVLVHRGLAVAAYLHAARVRRLGHPVHDFVELEKDTRTTGAETVRVVLVAHGAGEDALMVELARLAGAQLARVRLARLALDHLRSHFFVLDRTVLYAIRAKLEQKGDVAVLTMI